MEEEEDRFLYLKKREKQIIISSKEKLGRNMRLIAAVVHVAGKFRPLSPATGGTRSMFFYRLNPFIMCPWLVIIPCYYRFAFFKFQTFHDRSKLMKKPFFFLFFWLLDNGPILDGPRLDLPTNLCVHLIIYFMICYFRRWPLYVYSRKVTHCFGYRSVWIEYFGFRIFYYKSLEPVNFIYRAGFEYPYFGFGYL